MNPKPSHDHAAGKDLRLLLVEDNSNDVLIIKNMLSQCAERYQVEIATTGQEGMHWLEEGHFDCVVLDYRLPDTNALELLREIGGLYPKLPVALLTSVRDEKVALSAMKLGAVDCLFKDDLTQDGYLCRALHQILETADQKTRIEAPKAASLCSGHEDAKLAVGESPDIRVYHSLVESMSEGLITFDLFGTITYTNRHVAQWLGYHDVNAFLGRPVESIVAPQRTRAMREKIVWSKREKKMTQFESELVHNRGYFLPVLISQNPLVESDGKVQGLSWVVTDMSALKKSESLLREHMCALEMANVQLRRLDQMKSDFVSVVSHELRTPLAAMRESIALLLDNTAGEISDKQRHILDISQRNIDRLTRLINNLLNLAKMESGKQEPKMVQGDIIALAQDTVAQFQNLAQAGKVVLRCAAAPDLPQVRLDPDRITEVFANLISNAIKFTPEEGSVSVRARLFDKDPSYICVEVRDSGIGIVPEDMNKLFQKFQQIGTLEERKTGGTGLGLALCKEIVEAHGGRIWAESGHGKGSSFLFTLPVKGFAGGNRRRVLMIDDEDDIRITVKARLESQGMDVCAVSSGKQGLEKIQVYVPELILLDLMMPEMDGFEVLKRLKEQPQSAKTPVVVLTCMGDENSAKRALGLGAQGYLVKPFEKDALVFTVLELLKQTGKPSR